MGPETVNKNKDCEFNGPYAGRDLYITMYQDSEREFVVTHNANIKPVSYFTGRETELQELRQRVEEGRKSVLVSGMGGIGKTHICRKLFEDYLNKHARGENESFHHIGYIEYNGDMDSSLQNCLKFKQQDSPEQNREAAWRELEYLAADGKLLLFVDNVNVTIGEDTGLGRLKNIPGAVVLTSRRTSFSKEFEPYRIGFLSTEQCKEVYERIRYDGSDMKVPVEEVADLEYVINKLAAEHTITIEFLAHLDMTKHWNVEKLREELEQNGFCLEYRDEEDKLVNIQKSYEILYSLSGLSVAEQNILEAFSVFPYIPLAVDVCNQWLLSDAGVGEDADILTGLYRKGWLQFDIGQESYALHPVYAQFVYEKCKPMPKRHLGLIESCQKRLGISESSSALECQKYIPFAESIIERLGIWNNLEQISFIYKTAVMLYFYAGEYKKAESLYKKSLRVSERVLGEEHPATSASYDNLAGMYKRQGEYRKAEELYEKSLRIRERMLGEGHLATSASYNNLATVYRNQGEYKKAEGLLKKSLRIRERVLGEEHFDSATSYNNLAVVYSDQGEYKKAEGLFKKSLRIREKVLGKEHPNSAFSYNNLAWVYSDQGEYKKAEGLFKKSLRIWEKVLGEEHPDTALSYDGLAMVYQKQGEYGKAKELFEKVLWIRENALGENHPYTASSYNDLANVYRIQKEYGKAEELFNKSLQIYKSMLQENYPGTAKVNNNLAMMYEEQEEYAISLDYYLKAYKFFVSKLGLGHLKSRNIRKNMKLTYIKWDKESDFDQWLEEKMKE